MCGAVSVVAIVLGLILVVWHFINKTISSKLTIKNYLYMGANYSQIVARVWLKNMILLLAGMVLGLLFSFIITLIIGAICSVKLTLIADMVLIIFVLYVAFVSAVSVVLPVWTNTSKSV